MYKDYHHNGGEKALKAPLSKSWCMVPALLETFKIIGVKEKEAEVMVKEAQIQAGKIRNEAQQRAEETYRKTWKREMLKAERQSSELKEKARESAKSEAEVFLRQAEEQITEIRKRAQKKTKEAVGTVLSEILPK